MKIDERTDRTPGPGPLAKVSTFGDDYFAITTGRVALALVIFVVVSFTGIFFLLRRDQA